MKLLSIVIILVAMFGLIAQTNPKLDSYEQFINQWINAETKKEQNPVPEVLGSLFGGFAAYLMTKQTVRKDFIFFSTYDTTLGSEQLWVIGILNNFYILKGPEFKRNVMVE